MSFSSIDKARSGHRFSVGEDGGAEKGHVHLVSLTCAYSSMASDLVQASGCS